MCQKPFDLARSGDAVVVSETGLEPFQLAGRLGATTFVIFERVVYLDEVPEQYREALVSAAETCPVGHVLGAGADMRTVVVIDGIAAHTAPVDAARAASNYWQEYLSESGDVEDDPHFKYG